MVPIRKGAQQTDLNSEVGRVLTKAADQSRWRYFQAKLRISHPTEFTDKPVMLLASFVILLFVSQEQNPLQRQPT